jgi:hypothetical protein
LRNTDVVNESWVHSAVVSERLANRTHANGNVEVVLYSIEEELADCVRSIWDTTGLLVRLSALFSYLLHIVRHHTRAQLVVDIFHERFVHEVII